MKKKTPPEKPSKSGAPKESPREPLGRTVHSQSQTSAARSGSSYSVDAERSHAETALFNDFLNGDDAAFRKLYDAYERPLYLYCVRFLNEETDAQDIFQEIWIRMHRLRGERAAVTSFSGLLFTIARNYCLNAIRDRKRLRNVAIEDHLSEPELIVRSVDLENADLRELLQKALQQIPDSQREAFILREYNGYSYEEIGEITGSTMINAKTRAWRAREGLRSIISAWLELRKDSGEPRA